MRGTGRVRQLQIWSNLRVAMHMDGGGGAKSDTMSFVTIRTDMH